MDDKLKENIGRRIRLIRTKMKLSQEKFGELLGTSGSTISAYEIGESFCSIPVLFKIAAIGYTTAGWLLMGDDKTQAAIEKLLSKEDLKLLSAFHQASEEDRKIILRVVGSIAKDRSKGG